MKTRPNFQNKHRIKIENLKIKSPERSLYSQYNKNKEIKNMQSTNKHTKSKYSTIENLTNELNKTKTTYNYEFNPDFDGENNQSIYLII
jgi:predicted RNase H-like nuclease (RuvC/YqgF family)